MCHVDEVGFALTLPTTTTWGTVGQPRYVPHEARQGRRLNAIGGYFSHGPQAGELEVALFASVPRPKPPKRAPGGDADGTPPAPALAALAAAHGLEEEDLGVIDSEVFLAFAWQLAGRPLDAPQNWQRERPLVLVVDNYQVHRSERVRLELRALAAADVYLMYLPAYCPELSRIEPHWKVTKYHDLRRRSYRTLGELKEAVEVALAQRRIELRNARAQTAQ